MFHTHSVAWFGPATPQALHVASGSRSAQRRAGGMEYLGEDRNESMVRQGPGMRETRAFPPSDKNPLLYL